jgi:hypothetical protein
LPDAAGGLPCPNAKFVDAITMAAETIAAVTDFMAIGQQFPLASN